VTMVSHSSEWVMVITVSGDSGKWKVVKMIGVVEW